MHLVDRRAHADAILCAPFAFSGLPQRKPATHIRIWMRPSLGHWVSWSLFQDQRWFARRIIVRFMDPNTGLEDKSYGAEAILDDTTAASCIEALNRLRISIPNVPESISLDGVRYGVEAVHTEFTIRITFRNEPPEGLRALADWLSETIDTLNRRLPEPTVPIDPIRF